MSEVNIPPGRVCNMPDVEPLALPSMEGLSSQQDQEDLQAVCSGRRRTCVLLNSPSPCVNSAICHIQEMRTRLENWFQTPTIFQPEIDPDKPTYNKTLRFQLRDSDSDATDLYVEGIAINAREDPQTSPLHVKIIDVLSEVVHLVERLEADRQYAEETLQKEKSRRKTLESKVDSISLWKLMKHSSIVQKEHEAWSKEIAELKWQLKMENQKIDQVQEKLVQTELLNQKLQEDVEFARNQIPIVRENLNRQIGIIHQIDNAQAEADDLYAKTKSHFFEVEVVFRGVEAESNKEKASIEHKDQDMRHHLSDKLQDLDQLKLFERNMHAQIRSIEKAILLSENECARITQQIPKIVEFQKIEEDRILQLNLEIENERQSNQKLKEELTSVKKESVKKQLEWKAEVSLAEARLQSKQKDLSALRKEIQEYEQNVENYKMKISESKKAVKQLCEERKQMLQKVTDNKEQWVKAEGEATWVTLQHSVTQAKLEEQEQLTFAEDQMARRDLHNLRKDLTNCMTTLEILKTECANVNKEIKKQKGRSELTNRKLQKELRDSSSVTQALDTKVKGMKELTENFEKIRLEHNKTLVKLKKKKTLKLEQVKAAQDLHYDILQKIDNTIARCTLLMNECEEYKKSSQELKKNVETIPEVIAELEKDLHVLDFKKKSAAHIMSTLQSDVNNWQQRTQRFTRTRTAHLEARKKQMEDTKGALKAAHIENKQQAIRYEDLKKILLEARQNSASALAVKNHAHRRFNYYTELSLLQKRMHKVLVKYLEQRTLRGLAELDWCQVASQQSDQKRKAVEGKLSEDVQLVSEFLQSFKDSFTSTTNVARNKQTTPDAAIVNE